jgi:hypothetical protein
MIIIAFNFIIDLMVNVVDSVEDRARGIVQTPPNSGVSRSSRSIFRRSIGSVDRFRRGISEHFVFDRSNRRNR